MTNSLKKLTRDVKEEARRQGFHLVGVTTPDPPPHLHIYESWLAAGHHAGMAWIASERARARRADPRQILPECQSILVLGIHHPPAAEPDGEGQIAAYARGADYHDVLPPRLKAIVDFIERQAGRSIANRWYTDTGPILERDFAQRAGLGWIGKNTCLIHPRRGSYILLAEILLGIALQPDPPFASDHCGSCTRCIEACPTNCILPNRTLDAGRCISYLTIEERGSIPAELRPLMGKWVFGCDICQQVCPWNQRFATLGGDSAFQPRPEDVRLSLEDELNLTPQEFNRKFKGTPIKRAKRRGYLRNVAIALGNRGERQAVPALTRALHDDEPLVRGHAAWALGRIGGAESASALRTAAQQEADPWVGSEIQQALHALNTTEKPEKDLPTRTS